MRIELEKKIGYRIKVELPSEIEKYAKAFLVITNNNRDMPDCSEFGSIGIRRTIAAGLARTW